MKTKIAITALLALLAFAGCSNKESTPPVKQKLSDTSATLEVGETKLLTVTPASQGLLWSSDDPTIATVVENSGLVTAIKAGTTIIRVEDPVTKFKAGCQITVEAGPEDQELVTTKLKIKVGETAEIEVTPNKDGLTWLSEETKIASVSPAGMVTGNKVGTVSILVYNNSTEFNELCEVTVEGNYNTFDPVITEWGITMDEIKAKETRTFRNESNQTGQDYLVYEGENEFVAEVWYAFHKETGLLIRVEMYATFTSDDNADNEWQEMLNFWGERMIEQWIDDDGCAFDSIDGKTSMTVDKSWWEYTGEVPVVYEPAE